MTAKKIVSPRFSFQGWKLSKWILGNGKTIKELLKVAIPAFIGWTITNNPELTFIATAAGKFILDCAEYYLKEKTEPA